MTATHLHSSKRSSVYDFNLFSFILHLRWSVLLAIFCRNIFIVTTWYKIPRRILLLVYTLIHRHNYKETCPSPISPWKNCPPLYTTCASPLQFVRPQRTYFTPDSPCPSCPFCPLGPGGPAAPSSPACPTSPETTKKCFLRVNVLVSIRKWPSWRTLDDSDQIQNWTT